jgi:hypothetical protein
MVDLGLAKIQVKIREDRNCERATTESEPTSPFDISENRRGYPYGLSARAKLRRCVREAFAHLDQFRSGSSSVGDLNAFRELVEGQPPSEKMVAQGEHHVLPLGIRDAIGQVVQAPQPLCTSSIRGTYSVVPGKASGVGATPGSLAASAHIRATERPGNGSVPLLDGVASLGDCRGGGPLVAPSPGRTV